MDCTRLFQIEWQATVANRADRNMEAVSDARSRSPWPRPQSGAQAIARAIVALETRLAFGHRAFRCGNKNVEEVHNV